PVSSASQTWSRPRAASSRRIAAPSSRNATLRLRSARARRPAHGPRRRVLRGLAGTDRRAHRPRVGWRDGGRSLLRISLDGTWWLRRAAPGDDAAAPYHEGFDDGLAASVPGDVHADLLAAGLLEDPLVGTNA